MFHLLFRKSRCAILSANEIEGRFIFIDCFDIPDYTRIPVDEESDQDNVSIENQKTIIQDFIKQKSQVALLPSKERDCWGCTFEQRKKCQEMRRGQAKLERDASAR